MSKYNEIMEHIELTPFMTELVDKFRTDDFSISLHIEEPLAILGRPHELVRVFSNLLSNAQKYAHSATVSLGRREGEVQIIIDDAGPGIPAKKRADAFKPFFRLDKSRNSATGGVGLGLTIVRDAILAHGGTIKLETSPQKGLRVVIILPEKK